MPKNIKRRLFYARLWWVGSLGLIVSLGGIWVYGWQEPRELVSPVAATEEVLTGAQEPLAPLPLHTSEHPAKVALGERLFHDARLSGRNAIACATCHNLAHGGADGQPQAMAATGIRLSRNTPTIFNVAFNAAYNWDGVARTLEAHAERVLLSPSLMRTTWPELLTKLQAIPD